MAREGLRQSSDGKAEIEKDSNGVEEITKKWECGRKSVRERVGGEQSTDTLVCNQHVPFDAEPKVSSSLSVTLYSLSVTLYSPSLSYPYTHTTPPPPPPP